MNHLSEIYSPFVDSKVHVRLYLVCLTLHVWVRGLHVREGVTCTTLFGLFDSPCAGMRPTCEGGCYMYNNHIKPKSYELEPLGELVV